MKHKQKIGFWFRWPVILISLYLCFPLGLILMIVRISKNIKSRSITNKRKNLFNKDEYGHIDVPKDLVEKGKEIESNLKKELYCNKRHLPFEILCDIWWLLIIFLLLLAGCSFLLYHSFHDSTVTGIVMIITLNIVLLPFYWYVNKRVKRVKEENEEKAEWLNEAYQETFNAFVFSEYIERRLLSTGVIHGENDKANDDNPECRKFYHYNQLYKYHLEYKYAGHETERVDGFSGFSFDNSIWDFGPFCYNIYFDNIKKARICFLSPKSTQNEVVIFRKRLSGYYLNKNEKNDLKKYEMDNSRFNENFDVYAKNSIELFKIFTPSYMEKVIEFSEKYGVGFISIESNAIAVDLDSKFPTLSNTYSGYDVYQAVAYAENAFQYFMSFMKDISVLGI
ncbi:MAG: DUF3137 domain-containing protein [Clostridia bacterium]|nr:DUF3137 domain-containing protein [Clostridia bacterium]